MSQKWSAGVDFKYKNISIGSYTMYRHDENLHGTIVCPKNGVLVLTSRTETLLLEATPQMDTKKLPKTILVYQRWGFG